MQKLTFASFVPAFVFGLSSVHAQLLFPENVPNRVYFACDLTDTTGEIYDGYINARFTYGEDRAVLMKSVSWFSRVNDYPKSKADAAVHSGEPKLAGIFSLEWPAPIYGKPKFFNWQKGIISIHTYGFQMASGRKKQSQWRQYFIDRNDAFSVFQEGAERYLRPPISAPFLTTEILPRSSPGLKMEFEDFRAWSQNTEAIKVYGTEAAGRKQSSSSLANGNASPRILHSYNINPSVVQAIADAIELRVTKWETGLGDPTKTCQRLREVDESQIVVTSDTAKE